MMKTHLLICYTFEIGINKYIVTANKYTPTYPKVCGQRKMPKRSKIQPKRLNSQSYFSQMKQNLHDAQAHQDPLPTTIPSINLSITCFKRV